MKKKTLLLALVCGLCAWSALAQPPGDSPDQGNDGPPPGGPPPGRRGPPLDSLLIKALDTNGDGIIDANEIANAPAALLKLDKNSDGQLTTNEYLPQRPTGANAPPGGPGGRGGPGPGGKRPMPPIIAALDANGDGIIDAKEIANASAALLTLDKNGDGKLTPDEWRPKFADFGGGPGGPGGRAGPGNGPPGDGPPGDGPPGDGPPGDGPPMDPPPDL